MSGDCPSALRMFSSSKTKSLLISNSRGINFFLPWFPFFFFFVNQTQNLIYYLYLIKPFSFPYISSTQIKAHFLNIFAYKCTDGYKHKAKKQTLCWKEAVNHLRTVVHFIWTWQAAHTEFSTSQYIYATEKLSESTFVFNCLELTNQTTYLDRLLDLKNTVQLQVPWPI